MSVVIKILYTIVKILIVECNLSVASEGKTVIIIPIMHSFCVFFADVHKNINCTGIGVCMELNL
jgi:hypothetical protein